MQIPNELYEKLDGVLTQEQINLVRGHLTLAEEPEGPMKAPQGGKTDEGYFRDSYRHVPGLGYFKIDDLTPQMVDQMLTNGQVYFAFELKKGPIIAHFRDWKRWRFQSADKNLEKKAQAGLRHFLYHSIPDLARSMEYGASYHEVVWEPVKAKDLGFEEDEDVGPEEDVWIPLPVRPIHPDAVLEIKYTIPTDSKPKEYDGLKVIRSDGKIIDLERERTLIITHNKKFKNLKGTSMLAPAYIYWYFYEQIWRAAIRYYERIGQPIVVVHYPSRETVEYNNKTITAGEYALIIGQEAPIKTTLAIPSDVEVNMDGRLGQPKWKVEFLAEPGGAGTGSLFTAALSALETQITRAMVLGDLVGMQQEENGAYALSETHAATTNVNNEAKLLEIVLQVERYMLPRFAKFNAGPLAALIRLMIDAIDGNVRMQNQQLFSMLGQTHQDAQKVDFQGVGEAIGIPFKTEEQINADAEAATKRAVDNAKAMADAMPQPVVAGGAPGAKPAAKGFPAKDKAKAKPAAGAKKSFNDIEHYLDFPGAAVVEHPDGTRTMSVEIAHNQIVDFMEWYLHGDSEAIP